MTPADELRTAVRHLYNPLGNPRAVCIDEEVRTPLAAWLDQTATLAEALPAITAATRALAVARAINGSQP